jgi:hypothetical protein
MAARFRGQNPRNARKEKRGARGPNGWIEIAAAEVVSSVRSGWDGLDRPDRIWRGKEATGFAEEGKTAVHPDSCLNGLLARFGTCFG